jgi:sulfite reductase beta subunit-like hemoprotein
MVGGTLGIAPKLAQPLGAFVEPNMIFDVTKAMVEIFRDFGRREAKAKARFRWLVEEWGIEKLRTAVEEKIGKPLERYELDRLPVCEDEHIGVHPQKQKGYSYISIPILGGILSTDKMLSIADVAEKYGSCDLRLSSNQNIIIINVPSNHVNSVVEALQRIGFPMKGSSLRWTTIACAGNFCGKAPEYPKKRAAEVIDYLEKHLGESLGNMNLRLSFSGCPNGCARHLTADIGLQGAQLLIEGKQEPCYNIYVGGSAGPNVSLGKLIGRGIRAEQIGYAVGNLIEVYIERKTNLESFHEFCDRHTVEELRLFLNPNLRQEANDCQLIL